MAAPAVARTRFPPRWLRLLGLLLALVLVLGVGDVNKGLAAVLAGCEYAVEATAQATVWLLANVVRGSASMAEKAAALLAKVTGVAAGGEATKPKMSTMARAVRNVTSDIDTAAGLVQEFMRACDAARMNKAHTAADLVPACALPTDVNASIEEDFRAFLARRAGARASIERVADTVLLLYKWVLPLLLLNAAGTLLSGVGGEAPHAQRAAEHDVAMHDEITDETVPEVESSLVEVAEGAAVSPVAQVALEAAAHETDAPRMMRSASAHRRRRRVGETRRLY